MNLAWVILKVQCWHLQIGGYVRHFRGSQPGGVEDEHVQEVRRRHLRWRQRGWGQRVWCGKPITGGKATCEANGHKAAICAGRKWPSVAWKVCEIQYLLNSVTALNLRIIVFCGKHFFSLNHWNNFSLGNRKKSLVSNFLDEDLALSSDAEGWH